MPDPSGEPKPALVEESGTDLLAAISREMVRNLKKYYGKGPIKAKTYLMDDFCLVVLRNGQLVAEDTMIEAGLEDTVRAFRQKFQDQMAERLVGTIEQLTGRKVITYQSQVLFDPHIVCELFFFDDELPDPVVRQTVAALTDRERGVVNGDEGPSGEFVENLDASLREDSPDR